jgi:energy-converting hydrogenase Eha subunit G
MIPTTLALPLAVTGVSLGTVTGSARVLQGVILYFMTPQGSRALVPEFGVPAAPYNALAVPAWVQEVQDGLLLLQGVVRAVVLVGLGTDSRLKGTVTVTTDGGELISYDIASA